jgi:hypothetical protein
MTEPTALPETGADRVAQAKLKQEQREQGIRAQAIQEGMRKATADIELRLGKQALESGPLLAAHAKELDRRDADWAHKIELIRETGDRKANAKLWKGGVIGIIAGLLLAAGVLVSSNLLVMNGTFDASERFQFQRNVVDTLRDGAQ